MPVRRRADPTHRGPDRTSLQPRLTSDPSTLHRTTMRSLSRACHPSTSDASVHRITDLPRPGLQSTTATFHVFWGLHRSRPSTLVHRQSPNERSKSSSRPHSSHFPDPMENTSMDDHAGSSCLIPTSSTGTYSDTQKHAGRPRMLCYRAFADTIVNGSGRCSFPYTVHPNHPHTP